MRTLLIAALLTVTACSSSAGTATPTTEPATTTPATETTVAPETTKTPPAALSRDARVAIERCLDEASLSLPLLVQLDGPSAADKAKDLCDEAANQVSVDSTGDKVIGRLGLALADLNVIIAKGALDAALDGEFDAKELQAMLDGLSATTGRITGLMSTIP